jgi:hypothetical protein
MQARRHAGARARGHAGAQWLPRGRLNAEREALRDGRRAAAAHLPNEFQKLADADPIAATPDCLRQQASTGRQIRS